MKHLRNGLLLGAAVLCALPSATVLHAQDASPDASSSEATTRTIQMVPAKAYLNKTLDAKKAKQGDPVMAKLQDAVKISDAQELPRNTVLIGHIDQVQASENKSDSSIQVTFDKAQLKNGQELPIKATIIQIMAPMNASAMQMSGGAPVSGGGASAPSGGSNPAASGGSHGSMSSGGASAPQPMSSGASEQQPTAQQSGVDGVILQSDIHGSNSGTFLSKGKNVRLTDGTQMQFALAVVPANTQVQ